MVVFREGTVAILLSVLMVTSMVGPVYAHPEPNAVEVNGPSVDPVSVTDTSPSFVTSSVSTSVSKNTSLDPVGQYSEREPNWLRSDGYTTADDPPVNATKTASDHREEAAELLAELAAEQSDSEAHSTENRTEQNDSETGSLAETGEDHSDKASNGQSDDAGDSQSNEAGDAPSDVTDGSSEDTADRGSSGRSNSAGNESERGGGPDSIFTGWAWGVALGERAPGFIASVGNASGDSSNGPPPNAVRTGGPDHGGATSSSGEDTSGPNADDLLTELNETNAWTVDDALADAREAHERGQELEDRSPVAAITQYHEAWLHAQRALDVMDEDVEPVVWIETREDIPHSEPIDYEVQGIVFDVRPHERTETLAMENLTEQLTYMPLTKRIRLLRYRLGQFW